MAEIKLYSIFDLKAQTFSSVICDTRENLDDYLKFVINDSKTIEHDHSNDFILYELGDFDMVTGSVQLHDKKALHSLADYKIYKTEQ